MHNCVLCGKLTSKFVTRFRHGRLKLGYNPMCDACFFFRSYAELLTVWQKLGIDND
jgi:hypothetical protein